MLNLLEKLKKPLCSSSPDVDYHFKNHFIKAL